MCLDENPFTRQKQLRFQILHFYWSFSNDIMAYFLTFTCLHFLFQNASSHPCFKLLVHHRFFLSGDDIIQEQKQTNPVTMFQNWARLSCSQSKGMFMRVNSHVISQSKTKCRFACCLFSERKKQLRMKTTRKLCERGSEETDNERG